MGMLFEDVAKRDHVDGTGSTTIGNFDFLRCRREAADVQLLAHGAEVIRMLRWVIVPPGRVRCKMVF